MKITKQTLNRALRTFIQTVIGYAAINIVTIDFSASKQVLKSALIGLGGDGTVNVMLYHREAILFRIGGAFPDLTFNGFFALTVSRIAGIDHGGHGRHLPFIHH